MIRSISYGGGVQSTALVVLAAQRKIDFPLALFANTGDDSEHPASLAYVREVAMPWAAQHGVEVVELRRTRRNGDIAPTIYEAVVSGRRSIDIPIRMANGAPGNRKCTADWKIKVIGRELRRRGASETNVATVAVGISTDEYQRANSRRPTPYEDVTYPLLDLRLSRGDCMEIIRRAGLPVPPKSSCWFCPFRSPANFAVMARDEPDLFAKAVDFEQKINVIRAGMGRDPAYLTRFNMPLDKAITAAQDELDLGFNDGRCDDGFCWT